MNGSIEQAPARRGDGVPPVLAGAAGWIWRVLVITAGVVLLGMLARKLSMVTLPMAVALLITALLNPVNTRLRRLRLPRPVAALLTVLLAFAVIGGVGVFVYNRASAQYGALVDQVSTLIGKVQHWLITGPLKLSSSTVNGPGNNLVNYLRGGKAQGALVSGAVSVGKTALTATTAVILTFFLTVFMLYDGDGIWNWICGLFPAGRRGDVHRVGDNVWRTLSGYVTGTFTVALFHGLVMGVTLAVVGVPLVVPLAVLIFIGSFIPVIGAVVFGGLAVLVTLITIGPTASLIVLAVLLVENQVESHLLQPFIVGRYVRLHPMAIALTLTAGSVIDGLTGAIFCVPLVAAINAGVRTLTGRDPLPVAELPPDAEESDHAPHDSPAPVPSGATSHDPSGRPADVPEGDAPEAAPPAGTGPGTVSEPERAAAR